MTTFRTYQCWLADECERDGFDIETGYVDLEDAAEKFAEKLCDGDSDYYKRFASGQDVCVRDGDRVATFCVSVDWSPNFSAQEKE